MMQLILLIGELNSNHDLNLNRINLQLGLGRSVGELLSFCPFWYLSLKIIFLLKNSLLTE